MKLKKMAVALCAALAAYAGAAFALVGIDMRIYISGSPVMRDVLMRLLAQYCKPPGDPTAWLPAAEYELSPGIGGTSAEDFRNYQCTFKGGDWQTPPELITFGLAGKTASIYHSVSQTSRLGGSITGVTPLVRPINLIFVDPDDSSGPFGCVANGIDAITGFPLTECENTKAHRPDVGVSDVEPTLLTGPNLPGFAPYNVAAFPAQPGDDHISVNTLFVEGFGVALTKKLHDGLLGGPAVTNLSHQQVTGLLSGVYDNWNQLGGPNVPITLITRTNGSGTKAFFNAAFLENPCGANVVPADPTSTGPTGTLVVHEWDNLYDVRTDLHDVDAASGGGVAIMELLHNSSASFGAGWLEVPPGWTYATIDGQSVYVSDVRLDVADGTADHILEDQIINGNWKYFSEATLQFRDAGPNALTGLPLAFAQMISNGWSGQYSWFGAGVPSITKQLPGVVSPSTSSSGYPVPRRTIDGVSNFTRGGNTCSPGIFDFWG